jgi:hypothetical protein
MLMRKSPPLRQVVESAVPSPRRLRDPVVQADLMIAVKAAGAATGAWLLAVHVFDVAQPFLAPWSALLTVHATVYRSISRGAQQVAATVLGVFLSYFLAELLGINAVTLAAALLVALLLARVGVLRDEGVTVATTALFVLTTGYGQQENMLGDRIAATALGIAVGVLVNLLVFPPLDSRSAAQHVDHIDRRLGDLLTRMAESIRVCGKDETSAWLQETREIDRELDHAWELVGLARESVRLNPRTRIRRARPGRAGVRPGAGGRTGHGGAESGAGLSYEEVLLRLEDGVAEARSLARTIRESTAAAHEWDPRFREPWLELLAETGAGVRSPEKSVEPLHDRVEALTRELSGSDLPDLRWPVYGALLTNVHNIIDVVDDVASALPVRV